MLFIAGPIFLIIKWDNYKEDLKQLGIWLKKNKFIFIPTILILLLLPIFYVAPSIIYIDFLAEATQRPLDFENIKRESTDFITEFFKYNLIDSIEKGE